MIDIARIRLSRGAVIDHFPHIAVESALAHLSRVGLAEAHCYLLPPRCLSDGQRWRLRLALALSQHDGGQLRCFLCDEFATLLDPLTACVVARVLRRAISPESNLCAVVACARSDIIQALSPDLIIRCDFGKTELWKRTRGGSYVLEGETAQTSGFRSRATHRHKGNARG